MSRISRKPRFRIRPQQRAKYFQNDPAFIREPERFSGTEFLAAILLRGDVPALRSPSDIARNKHGYDRCRPLGHVMDSCPNLKRLITDHQVEILKGIFAKLKTLNSDWLFELGC